MMNDIHTKQTSKTPDIRFVAVKGLLELKGVSIPEDAEAVYSPLMKWAESYVENTTNDSTTFAFKLIYFNTSTSDYLIGILKILKRLLEKGLKLEVIWYYEEDDDDMKETGNHFQTILEIPFSFESVAEIV